MVLIFIGINRLYEMVTGLSVFILITSANYRWDLLFTFGSIVVCVWTNYLLIPDYGIDGAAVATLSGSRSTSIRCSGSRV